MHQALYRKFRPETFDSILGQEHIVKILQNQVTSGTTGHAYLFAGTRGTGKTTTARVLAKGVNCTAPQEIRPCGICENCQDIKAGVFMDVIEIDAASNNGVDNIRELRESVKYAPVKGSTKVYVIDEVHMLSSGAFNALLKTLEEPPEYVMFILATTEPSKLPATVLSRCMRLDFRRVAETTVIESMKDILSQLGVNVDQGGLKLIAANGDGSVRDSLSLLDKCLATGNKNISREDVLEALGTRGEEEFIALTDMVKQGFLGDVLLYINENLAKGIDPRQFLKDWTNHYRNLMLLKHIERGEDILNLSEENMARMKDQSQDTSQEEINRAIYILAEAVDDTKWSSQPRIHLELAAARLAGGLAEVEARPVQGKAAPRPAPTTVPSRPVPKAQASEPRPEPGSARSQTQAPQAPQAPQSGLGEAQTSKVWEKVLAEAEDEKASLNLLRKACVPVCTEEGCLMLEITSATAKRIVDENINYLQDLLDKHADKSLRLDSKMAENNEAKDRERRPEELAEEIEDRLNIEVELV